MAAGESAARRTATAAAWTVSLVLTGRHGVGAWQLAQTMSYLARRAPAPRPGQGPPPPVHVVVPVLREQDHVRPALDWWREILPLFPGMSLTLVSTAREDHDRGLLARAVCDGPLTSGRFPQLGEDELAMLRSARQRGRLPAGTASAILARVARTRDVIDLALAGVPGEPISHLTYPGLGRKAAQVNYAARFVPSEGYLAVYDVDSRPSPQALAAVHACLAGMPPAVQLHALFLAGASGGPPAGRWLARGAGVLQSVWTLRREIPYARRHRRFTGSPGALAALRAGLSQPVGHGLYLRHDVHAAIGGFPEDSVLDDVPAGVALTLAGIPVVSVPVLTTVPAAESVAEIIAQGRRWFWSYLDYPALLRDAAARQAGTAARRRLVAAVALYRGTAWLAASPVTLLAALAAVAPRSRPALRVTALAGLALGVVVPVAATARVRGGRRSPAGISRDCGAVLAAYLLRSAGPWLAVADAARGRRPSTATPAPKANRTPQFPGGRR
jgi:hypothetical protein